MQAKKVATAKKVSPDLVISEQLRAAFGNKQKTLIYIEGGFKSGRIHCCGGEKKVVLGIVFIQYLFFPQNEF